MHNLINLQNCDPDPSARSSGAPQVHCGYFGLEPDLPSPNTMEHRKDSQFKSTSTDNKDVTTISSPSEVDENEDLPDLGLLPSSLPNQERNSKQDSSSVPQFYCLIFF